TRFSRNWSSDRVLFRSFHDGSPVRAKDAVASVKRWSQRQPGGIALMQRAESLEATGDLGFELKLRAKFGPVLEVFADPSLPLPEIGRASCRGGRRWPRA